jgi:hypothetical protein
MWNLDNSLNFYSGRTSLNWLELGERNGITIHQRFFHLRVPVVFLGSREEVGYAKNSCYNEIRDLPILVYYLLHFTLG